MGSTSPKHICDHRAVQQGTAFPPAVTRGIGSIADIASGDWRNEIHHQAPPGTGSGGRRLAEVCRCPFRTRKGFGIAEGEGRRHYAGLNKTVGAAFTPPRRAYALVPNFCGAGTKLEVPPGGRPNSPATGRQSARMRPITVYTSAKPDSDPDYGDGWRAPGQCSVDGGMRERVQSIKTPM